MKAIELNAERIDLLTAFEKEARATEPDIFISGFDENNFKTATLTALSNPNFASAKCLLCADENDHIIGRIDFSLLPSLAFGGEIRAYVDWIYVLKKHRHKGVAQFLFKEMEKYLKNHGINEYFLITAENEESKTFYNSIPNAEISKHDVLTKNLT
ncbi:MAG: GNAT family N-acetyltransferase [Defluviitaleaceae bacterium]|nr:GNAT family N-acetyltransferase [Defluviitaleaceae bacterium]